MQTSRTLSGVQTRHAKRAEPSVPARRPALRQRFRLATRTGLPDVDEGLVAAAEACLQANGALVRQWREGVPGSWGALAGKAVLLYRERLGRRLTDAERRAVWAALWARLQETR